MYPLLLEHIALGCRRGGKTGGRGQRGWKDVEEPAPQPLSTQQSQELSWSLQRSPVGHHTHHTFLEAGSSFPSFHLLVWQVCFPSGVMECQPPGAGMWSVEATVVSPASGTVLQCTCYLWNEGNEYQGRQGD